MVQYYQSRGMTLLAVGETRLAPSRWNAPDDLSATPSKAGEGKDKPANVIQAGGRHGI
jgi:hypothetical protein